MIGGVVAFEKSQRFTQLSEAWPFFLIQESMQGSQKLDWHLEQATGLRKRSRQIGQVRRLMVFWDSGALTMRSRSMPWVSFSIGVVFDCEGFDKIY